MLFQKISAMKGVLFLVLVGMLVALTTSTQEQPHSKNSVVTEQFHPTSKDLTGRKAKLIALRSSTTRTVIQSSTTFALSTCIEQINDAATCNGKRKRKRSLAHRKTNLNTEWVNYIIQLMCPQWRIQGGEDGDHNPSPLN